VNPFTRSEIRDTELLRNARLHARDERAGTALLLADIGEIDARRLFVPAGHPSLFEYCRGALKLSEDAAARRIQAARAARRHPTIFAMCADGRLSLTAITLLAPHLTEQNADELLALAAGRSKAEVEELIRARRPLTETMGWVQPLATTDSPAPARVDAAPRLAATPASTSPAPARVKPIARERFSVQGTLGRRAADALRFAQDTTGNDLSSVLEAALLLYASHLRKRKCGATTRPQLRSHATTSARHVPARVRRQVWQRDAGRCTFTSDDGHRCGSTRRLEYDHVVPVARGGESTVGNLRLRCRAHNQYEAERTFGAAFMAGRRERARAYDAAGGSMRTSVFSSRSSVVTVHPGGTPGANVGQARVSTRQSAP